MADWKNFLKAVDETEPESEVFTPVEQLFGKLFPKGPVQAVGLVAEDLKPQGEALDEARKRHSLDWYNGPQPKKSFAERNVQKPKDWWSSHA